MKPDTYKPTLSVQVLPTSKEDQFVPGETYAPRTGKSSAAASPSATRTLLPLLLLLPLARFIN